MIAAGEQKMLRAKGESNMHIRSRGFVRNKLFFFCIHITNWENWRGELELGGYLTWDRLHPRLILPTAGRRGRKTERERNRVQVLLKEEMKQDRNQNICFCTRATDKTKSKV
jgi:hypothetical protein